MILNHKQNQNIDALPASNFSFQFRNSFAASIKGGGVTILNPREQANHDLHSLQSFLMDTTSTMNIDPNLPLLEVIKKIKITINQ